jgi:hypothetical protein
MSEHSSIITRLESLVLEMRSALEANGVFHTSLVMRKLGGHWKEYEADAINRTRAALLHSNGVINQLKVGNHVR